MSDNAAAAKFPKPLLRRTAVLGAGAMGSRIAAHLANAGVPVLLLDLAQPGPEPSLAAKAIAALLKAKPAAFYDPASAALITAGDLDRDLPQLATCDWIIEAVSENLAIKQALLEKIQPHLSAAAIVTTNTSGLPIAAIAEKTPPEFRRRWFGTHFFNPPRYMRLVEIIPTLQTDSALTDAIADFADRRLGKTVVFARDTPNFIANRIGVFSMLTALRLMQEQGLSIEEVDALTGSVIGWPRTGTFRLADMVGIDVLAHVAKNFAASRSEDASATQLPPFLETMLQNRWFGDKAGQGFYKKDPADPKNRLALDWRTLEYRPAQRPKFPSIEMAKNAASLGERLRLILAADPKKDKAASFLIPLFTGIWSYAAQIQPEIADSPADVDRAMQAGFNWELGPFAMAAAVGKGAPLPNAAPSLLHRAKLVRKNPGCSLFDTGDGIALLELHSLKNAIGDDIVSLVTQTLASDGDAVRNFRGFVIGSQASDFSVGANLMQLLLAMQEGDWDEVNLAIRAFQRMTAAVKFCPRPVVLAPFNLCLGGGVEISLHAARRHPHAELYMGLVESGVGLIPAGGGTKEMAFRATDAACVTSNLDPTANAAKFARSTDFQHALRQRFETMALAKVSTSAAEARSLGFLSPSDSITMNRDGLFDDARATAIALAEGGYAPPAPRSIPAAGEAALANLKLGIHLMRQAEYISDHDAKIAAHIARVLCGGALTPGTPVTEQALLDLEREAFLSLCGEPKTQERIAFTLKTGKPLRN
ncbi:MAG TPA: 3-hydroxyacyl-CoA dehydrogenase/enoyl-CoA hydratase family protein [Acidobacteriaceae bacterium]|nr:3-hydroxyacyl-CoA dehydrogenase/enoyl-CoA hydratase family protein [Acidobacteriaceae bacterium]